MVIIHKDDSVYNIDKGDPALIWYGHYSFKFRQILYKENISHRIIDYIDRPDYGEDNWKGDYFVGRFGQEITDKNSHSLNFDMLYDYYGEKMWPNKKAYYYYDDKVRQYELLERYGIHIPSIICNDLDELLNNTSVGTVVKSAYGAGGESSFYIWNQEHLNHIEEYISNCYNSEDFFPCIVQEYIDHDYEYHIFSTFDEIYGYKKKILKEYVMPTSFPYNNVSTWTGFTYMNIGGGSYDAEYKALNERELEDFIEFVVDIKTELNTPNLKFDIVNGKVFEFSYLYNDTMQITDIINQGNYLSYDLKSNSFINRNYGSGGLSHWNYLQTKSILRHLGIIK